jgi:carbamoyl-phosphate synthase large subunit
LAELVKEAFLIGFPSPTISSLLLGEESGLSESYRAKVAEEIEAQKVMPVFKMVDTCAGEFESRTPYYYGTFEQEDDARRATLA